MLPTLRQLEYLVAVDEHRHFQRAAEASLVTQPALSAQLKQLERVLGVQLFDRSARRVVPTAAGEALVARARSILREADDLVEAARALREPLAGPLRIGVIPTVAPYLLPAVLPPVLEHYPDLQPWLHEGRTPDLVEQLESGSLDVAILAVPTAGDWEVEPIVEDPFVLAVPLDHPFAHRRRLKESDLAGERLMLLEDGH